MQALPDLFLTGRFPCRLVGRLRALGRSGGSWHASPAGGTLGCMGRQKTISDEEVLRIARDVFLEKGHIATTREIAQAAGISEAILYQRFGSKQELFFTAMRPTGP